MDALDSKEVVLLPFEVWSRLMFERNQTWEEFYRMLPPDIILLPSKP